MINIKKGSTRIVILIFNIAIKIPNFFSWRLFLQGLLANMQEKTFNEYSSLLCPVIFYIPGGFFIVMPKCFSLKEKDRKYMFKKAKNLDIEQKLCSFGWLNKKVVAVDYGN